MSFSLGSGVDAEQLQEIKRVNEAITRQLKEEKRQRKRDNVDSQLTLLVLGGRGSGKTTLIKLLKIMLHHDELDRARRRRGRHTCTEEISEEPFSEKDKKGYTTLVYKNVFVAIKELVLAMRKYSIQYENPANEELWERFASIDPNTMTELSNNHCSLIKQLWNDRGVYKECYERRKELNLSIPESSEYFLDALDRISSKWFSPKTEDILIVYEPTTGTVSYSFTGIRVIEIGNQSLERPNKWIQLFDRVCTVYFVVDVSEYDMILESSHTIRNRLEASRLLFENLCQIYVCPVIVLCFTKKDIFDEKIHQSDLANHFPAYTGPKRDPDAAMTFISDMFTKPLSTRTRMAICYVTICATNVDSTQKISASFRDSIVRYHLSGILL